MNATENTSKYAAGQIWSYQTRPQEPASTLTIVKVETVPTLGTVVHIAVTGLQLKNSHAPLGLSESIDHMPFDEAAIDGSVTRLIRENAPLSPDYEEGYGEWKAAFDNHQAGVFGITVAQAIEGMEIAIG